MDYINQNDSLQTYYDIGDRHSRRCISETHDISDNLHCTELPELHI